MTITSPDPTVKETLFFLFVNIFLCIFSILITTFYINLKSSNTHKVGSVKFNVGHAVLTSRGKTGSNVGCVGCEAVYKSICYHQIFNYGEACCLMRYSRRNKNNIRVAIELTAKHLKRQMIPFHISSCLCLLHSTDWI